MGSAFFTACRLGACWFLGCGLLASVANAQFLGGNSNQQTLPAIPGNSAQQATPDQISRMLWLRALQSRGNGRGVQRGVPQFVPLGGLGYNIPAFGAMNAQMNAQQMQGAAVPGNGNGAAPQQQSDRDAKREATRERLREQREAAEAARQARIKARLQGNAQP